MCFYAVVIFLSLVPGYRENDDDRNANPFLDSDDLGYRRFVSVTDEQELFRYNGICASNNLSQITTCSSNGSDNVETLYGLKHTNCYCDNRCVEYQDCCIDKVPTHYRRSDGWTCREVKGENVSRIPIYVYQQCPRTWDDAFVRDMCEVEAIEREKMGLVYDHLQDLPVMSDASRTFYRNVYCAVCNRDAHLVKWETYIYCNGDSERPHNSLEEELDFSTAVYVPRTMNYRKVRVGDRLKNCQIIVRNFNLKRILSQHGARLCKPTIDSCPDDVDLQTRQKCKAYSSYVYKTSYSSARREVYNNFHCAMCNGVAVDDLSCLDPYSPLIYGNPPWGGAGKSALTMLFDFNFRGGVESVGGISPCLMSEGQVWDPIFKRCQNFTCGSRFKREGFKCLPLNGSDDIGGIKNNCLKIILDKDDFFLVSNGSVYINTTMQLLSLEEYEVFRVQNKIVMQIAVCLDANSHLLPYSKAHSWLSIITLSVSITCLMLHLLVYGMLEKLRNCPGKVLMSLSASLLCGHIFLLLGPHFTTSLWLCYFNSVATHFGYLSAFSWMSVMAYDIHGTFSVTQSQNTRKSKAFVRYSLYAWISSFCVVILSITVDNSLTNGSDFRPKYAEPICWFNNRKGLLIFFVVPATILLFANIVLFAITAFHIRKISRQTKMVNNFSDKVRYFLYLKLAIVLGLTWFLGLLAGITRMDAFWYPFIVLNGLQGALIFIAFTIKRNIFNMLAVKLKIRSDKYRISNRSGIKAAMYSSLSNLTTLQTTVTSQIPSLADKQEMLKAVRRINPDAIIEQSKS